MKIALVHDYLITYGGAERVLEALHKIWPEAPVYTAWVDWPWVRQNKPEWQKWEIKTSWFDKIPGKKQLCSPLRFLAPKIWSSFDLSEYDIVISSSAWYMAKGVSMGNIKYQKLNIKNKKSETGHQPYHLCYCHTPPRYLYGYDTTRSFNHPLVRLYAYFINPFMRCYDFRSSQAIDLFIANSEEVKKRIRKFYRKEAVVVYPPVFDRVKKATNNQAASANYYLTVNRLVKSKNTEIAVKACQRLGVRLKIVGEGPEYNNLKSIIYNRKDIQLLGYVSEAKLAELYRDCQAVIYLPKDEDFGLVPVEAQAYGQPVIAVDGGGVKETVIHGKTGWLIKEPAVDLLISAIKKLPTLKIDRKECQKQAAKFTEQSFRGKIINLVEILLK